MLRGRFSVLSRSGYLRLLLAVVVLAQPLAIMAATWTPWTTVGSAGTVDSYDIGNALFSGLWVGVDFAAPLPYTVDVRYNVVAVEGLTQGGGRHYMKVRYLDNGDLARVIVSLKELDLTTGALTTRITFDSNLFPASGSGQTQTVNVGCSFPFPPAPWGYNFEDKAYYLETQLIKTGASGSAWLAGVQLRDEYCVG